MYTQSFNVPDGAATAKPVAAVPTAAQQQVLDAAQAKFDAVIDADVRIRRSASARRRRRRLGGRPRSRPRRT